MTLQKAEQTDSKRMTVNLDIDSIFRDTILKDITNLKEEIKQLEKKILISTVLTRFFWQLKLKKVQDKLYIQELLYKEYNKLHPIK